MAILGDGTQKGRFWRSSAYGLAAVTFLLSQAVPLCAIQGQPVDEYQVKAAFIYNFAKFVQWPAGAFQNATEPVAICIAGMDPFGKSLEETVSGRSIEGRNLVVRHVSTVKQSAGCHILFFGGTDDKRLGAWLSEIRTAGILTIGESDNSSTDGVVINFRLDDGRIRFDINIEAGENEKLRISSRLLSLARNVARAHK
ncbi:MAG: YfiR family protein [Acidobacteriota bacterium]|nr:YfiR family protein [Acidobacteriota bacterium]